MEAGPIAICLSDCWESVYGDSGCEDQSVCGGVACISTSDFYVLQLIAGASTCTGACAHLSTGMYVQVFIL